MRMSLNLDECSPAACIQYDQNIDQHQSLTSIEACKPPVKKQHTCTV